MVNAYRPVRSLSRLLVALLATCGALGALGALLGLVQGIVFPELAAMAEAQSNPQIAMQLGSGCQALLYLGAFVATAVVFSMFLHRCCGNAHALGAEGMEFTPGWTVGWFFIPIMNLFKPYQAVQEIHRATDPEAGPYDWHQRAVPAVFGWWWALWLVSNFLGGMIGRAALSSNEAMLSVGPWLDVADGLLEIALCTVAAVAVRTLAARQEDKARIASFA